jgi:hypothetical protein
MPLGILANPYTDLLFHALLERLMFQSPAAAVNINCRNSSQYLLFLPEFKQNISLGTYHQVRCLKKNTYQTQLQHFGYADEAHSFTGVYSC